MTASTLLAQHGVTVAQARTFIMSNLNNLSTILSTSKQFGVTNDMLAEIYGGVSGNDVRGFFSSHGLDSANLDTSVDNAIVVPREGDFYQIDRYGSGYLSKVHIGSSAGNWTEYKINNSLLTQSDTGLFTISNASASGMTVSDSDGVRKITFSDAKNTVSIDSIQAPGLKQVTATFEVLSTPEVNKITDWDSTFWNGYSYYNPASKAMDTINTIEELKTYLVTSSAYLTVGDSVTPGGDNLDVKLVGASNATSGQLVKMVWNATHTGKIVDSSQVVPGGWQMKTVDSTQYLIVETTGIEREVYKIDATNTLVKVEENPAGTSHADTWYFGTDFTTFQAIGLEVLGVTNSAITSPDIHG